MENKQTRPRKYGRILLLFALLLTVATWALPHLLRLPLVHDHLQAYLSRQIPQKIQYETGSIQLFPRPRLQMRKVRVAAGSTDLVTIDSVSIHPRLSALLGGRIDISEMTVVRPRVCISLADDVFPNTQWTTGIQDATQQAAALLRTVTGGKGSRLSVKFRQGEILFTFNDQPVLSCRDMRGRLQYRPDGVSLAATCSGDAWKRAECAAVFDTRSHHCKGTLAVSDFTPAVLKKTPLMQTMVVEGRLSADIGWESRKDGTFEIVAAANAPDLVLGKQNGRLPVRGERITCTLSGAAAEIRELRAGCDLAAPAIKMTGSYNWQPGASLAAWTVSARDVNIGGIKTAASFFCPTLETAHQLFHILPEGDIPWITLQNEAPAPRLLNRLDAFLLHGRFENTTIHIPEPDLTLADSAGEVTVSDKVLEAWDVRSRLGGSTGTDGHFVMHLVEEEFLPYKVKVSVSADVSQLPPLLARLTDNQAFAGEMRRILAASGTARGLLTLDHTAKALELGIDATDFDVQLTYGRIPHPMTVSGEGFHYSRQKVTMKALSGSIGGSQFSRLDAAVQWRETPALSVSSAQALLDVDEVYAWLINKETGENALRDLRPTGGQIRIDRFRMSGPPQAPRRWRFNAEGAITRPAQLHLPFFSSPVTVKSGDFSLVPGRITAEELAVSVLDSNVFMSGHYEEIATKNDAFDLTITGTINPALSAWAHAQAGVPEPLRLRSPLAVSPLRVSRDGAGEITVECNAATGAGGDISFHVNRTDSRLSLAPLRINHKGNQAVLLLDMAAGNISADFSGHMDKRSADVCFAQNHLLTGALEGNFRTVINTAHPEKSTLAGKLHTTGIALPSLGVPLEINALQVDGDENGLAVSDTRFTWKTLSLSARGRVDTGGDALVLNADLTAPSLAWPQLEALLPTGKEVTSGLIPAWLRGTLHVGCDLFSTPLDAAGHPMQADITIDDTLVNITIREAQACGISFPGTITVAAEGVHYAFSPTAAGSPLRPTMACLHKGKTLVDGTFDLSGQLTAKDGTQQTVDLSTLSGTASLEAYDGRIYKAVLLAKVFSLLNVTELVTGTFPDLNKEGFPYKTAAITGTIEKGRLTIETGVIDSPAMKIFFEGTEDLVQRKHDLTIVVAPLKTVDMLVGKIPLVKDVLDKGALIYPVKIIGSWQEPALTLLSPTAVGGQVWGVVVRTLKLPLTILEKILPEHQDE